MSWSVLAKVSRFGGGFAATILIVRTLGKYHWGMLSVLKALSGFAFVIVMLGAGNALLKYLPTAKVKGGLHSFLDTFKKLLLIQILVWICLLALVRFGGPVIEGFFQERFERFGFYLQFAVAFVIFEVFMGLVTNFLQSWYETRKLAIAIIIGNTCYVVLLMLFLKVGWGIIGVLTAGAIVNLLMTLLLVPQVLWFVRSAPVKAGEIHGVGKIFRFSLPFVATGILNQIVWRQSEVIFLGHYHGSELSGFFELAYRVPQLLLEFIPITIWPIVMAGTAEVYARNVENLPRAIDLYYRLLYILVIPIAALGFAFSRSLVPILYGSQMLPAALFTQLFFIVFSYSFLYTPLSMALYVMGKSWVNMLVFTFLAVVNVGLDLALIPHYGIWGAFFPVAFVLLLGIVVFSIVMKKCKPDVKAPTSFIIRCYAAAVPTTLLAMTSVRWSSPAALILQMLAGTILLVLGFRFFKVIGENEKELIGRLPIPLKERILALF